MDEIGEKRNQNKTIEGAQTMMEGLMGQEAIQEFSAWCQENMPYDHLGCQANSMMGTILGCLIGTWYDAGATPEAVQEYLKRFADMVYKLNTAAHAHQPGPR